MKVIIMAGFGGLLLGLSLLLRRELRERKPGRYHPRPAWLLAGIWFCLSMLLAAGLQVEHLLRQPLVRPGQWQNPVWLLFTLLCLAAIGVAYRVIWRAGTFTDGRPWRPVASTFFGMMWGMSQGLIMLSFWQLAIRAGTGPVGTAAIGWAGLALYFPLFQSFFWDLYVSPPHNLRAWNVRKILGCHVPNLTFSMFWLAAGANYLLVVLLQVFVLTAAARAMHIPARGDDYEAPRGQER